MRILVAIDETEHDGRVVEYVGALVRSLSDVNLTLFHVLKPIPCEFLEHGGSENPALEEQLGSQLKKDQAEWYRKEREAECHYLQNALEGLVKAGVPAARIALQFGYEEDVARNILEEANTGHYETIVVGRHGVSRRTRGSAGSVTEQLLRQAKGLTVWVVD
jgi:nucleotide-binding universal stress UspA family protein